MRIIALLIGVATLSLPAAAFAQSNVEGRVGRLESEMRAVQRKVFPNGPLLQPEVTAPAQPTELPGTPAAGALVDLGARVSSLEQQMASLTGQTEQNGYQLRQLREQFDAYKAATDARLAALAPAAGAATPAAEPFGSAAAADGPPKGPLTTG